MPEEQITQTPPHIPAIFWIIYFGVLILMIASVWKAFAKAGEPGWAAIVPIYNAVVFLKIAGKPAWWVLLFFVPIANIIVGIMALVSFVERFGKGAGYVIGIIFLPFIFWPMLAFGDARYLGPKTDGPLGAPALS